MLFDYMATFPAPGPKESARQIRNYILNNHQKLFKIKIKSLKINEHIDILEDIAFEFCSTYPADYDMGYWHWRGLHTCVEIIIQQYISYINRKKIIAIVKTCAFLFRIYRKTCEEMYKPTGSFETEKALIWNSYLRNLE